jgi:hypothetical protein
VIDKATEVVVINMVYQLVKRGIFSDAEARALFGSAHIMRGENNAHQVGMALKYWGEMYDWLGKNLEHDQFLAEQERQRQKTAGKPAQPTNAPAVA